MTSRTWSEWLEFPVDVYLDARHRNWVLAEETGDVVFVAARGVVLVHRHRAEHVANALAAVARERITSPTPSPVLATPPATSTCRRAQAQTMTARSSSGRRDVLAWLGIVAGAAVYVAALAFPLDDPALVVALMLMLRGGRLIRAPGTLAVAVPADQRGQEEHHAYRPGCG
jgi:hypothetical protein